MMAGKNYDIATTIKLNGEKEFDEALKDANRSMRVMDSEMKKLEAAYDAGGTGMDYLSGRADVLSREMKQQEAIVDALRKAVEEQSSAYDEASEEVQKYQIKLNNAEARLSKLAKASETANRELEDLGRDSNKIGRQIENGIGDAAEDTADKLDGMFAKVSADVEELKSSVAFQTSMNVGSFVMDGIQSVMGFVDENRELNRKLAQARSVVEMFGHDGDEIIEIAQHAGSVVGDFESALDAVVNLSAAGFETEDQIRATVESLLGIWLSSAGTMDFSSLAEDTLETIKTKTPSGTYAEAVAKFTGRTEEDVGKILESMTTTGEVIEAATAVLTEAGMQTITKDYVNKNQETTKAEEEAIRLSLSMAGLALRLQPAVTKLTGYTADVVDGLSNIVEIMEGATPITPKAIEETNKAIEEYYTNPENDNSFGKWWTDFWGITPPKYKDDNKTAIDIQSMVLEHQEWERFAQEQVTEWFSNLFPSAGAEELSDAFPETDLQTNYEEKGALAGTAFTSSMLAAIEENPAMQQVMADYLAELSAENEAAVIAGNNAMISFANGIAQGSPIVMNNVNTLVNAINQALASISMPAIGYGLNGITGGNIYVSGEEVTNAVSRHMRRGVDNRKLTFR